MTGLVASLRGFVNWWFGLDHFSRPRTRDLWFIAAVAVAISAACWAVASGEWFGAVSAVFIIYWTGSSGPWSPTSELVTERCNRRRGRVSDLALTR